MRGLLHHALWLAALPLLAISCSLTAPSDEELVGSCDDDRKNGGETDADCGGPCGPCGPGRTCDEAADCTTGVCSGGVCEAPSCGDGVKNGTESDVDCGDLDFICVSCPTGKACRTDDDCEDIYCASGICAVPTCSDGVQNGDETDVDCGAFCPNLCGPGLGCYDGADCASGVCTEEICQ